MFACSIIVELENIRNMWHGPRAPARSRRNFERRGSMASLFEPFTLKEVTLKNRIAVSPMCQYSAEDGVVNAWHHAHLAGLARGGSGLVIAEATAVSPEGRITPGCAGLWSDAQAEAFAPAVRAIKAAGAVPGIQLAHPSPQGDRTP